MIDDKYWYITIAPFSPKKKTKSQSEWPGAALESCSSLPFPSDAFGSWVQHLDQYSTEQCCSSSRSIPFQGVGEQNKLETMEHIHFISRSLSCPAPFIAHKGNSQFTAPWCCIPWWSASSPGSVGCWPRCFTSLEDEWFKTGKTAHAFSEFDMNKHK